MSLVSLDDRHITASQCTTGTSRRPPSPAWQRTPAWRARPNQTAAERGVGADSGDLQGSADSGTEGRGDCEMRQGRCIGGPLRLGMDWADRRRHPDELVFQTSGVCRLKWMRRWVSSAQMLGSLVFICWSCWCHGCNFREHVPATAGCCERRTGDAGRVRGRLCDQTLPVLRCCASHTSTRRRSQLAVGQARRVESHRGQDGARQHRQRQAHWRSGPLDGLVGHRKTVS